MLKIIKKVLNNNSYTIAITITVAIAYLSLAKIGARNQFLSFSNSDKLKHFLAYFVLTCSWLFVIRKICKPALKIYVFIFVFIFGFIIEILQTFLVTYRQGDGYDILANSVGILTAIMFFDKIFDFYKGRYT